ncbi:hypothetical protein ACF0H5_011143 [Mactra antiquata]
MTFSPRKLEIVLKEVNENLMKEGLLTQRLTQDIWTKLMSNLLQGEYLMALPIRQDLQTHVRKKRPDKIYTFNQIIYKLDEILDRYIPPPDLNSVVTTPRKGEKSKNKPQNTLLLPSKSHDVRASINEFVPEQPTPAIYQESKIIQHTPTKATVQTAREKLQVYTDEPKQKSDKEMAIQTSRSLLRESTPTSRKDTTRPKSLKDMSIETDKEEKFEEDEISREQYLSLQTNQGVLQSTIENQQMKIKTLEESVNILEQKNTSLQEEIKTISEIKGDKIEVYSKAEREIKFLRNELKIKEKTLQLSLIERNELLDKLGSVTTTKFANGNTGVTDLSDINKPTQIADKYDKLYGSEWMDSFHLLTLEMKEEKLVIQWLLTVLQDAYWFCLSTNESHTKMLMENLQYPFRTSEAKVDPYAFDDVTKMLLCDLKKATAEESMTQVQVHFLQTMQKSKKPMYEQKVAKKLMLYIDKCVELCWYMVNQNPVVTLDDVQFNSGDDFDRDAYRFYGKAGSKIDYLVWPALFINNRDGYMIYQGVAQAKQEGVALRIASSPHMRGNYFSE